MKRGLEIFGALLGGALLGGTAALLLAPDTGERQRRKIKVVLERHGVRLAKEELDKLVEELKGTFSKCKRDSAEPDPAQDYDAE